MTAELPSTAGVHYSDDGGKTWKAIDPSTLPRAMRVPHLGDRFPAPMNITASERPLLKGMARAAATVGIIASRTVEPSPSPRTARQLRRLWDQLPRHRS